jgi:hypothetical protein
MINGLNMMDSKKVWNTSPYEVRIKYGTDTVILLPFSEIDVSNDTFLTYVNNYYACYGVVILDSTALKEDETFVEYKLKKELEGLFKLLKFKKDRLEYEKNYINDQRLKNDTSAENVVSNKWRFEKDIKHIQKMITAINGKIETVEEEYVIPERKEWDKDLAIKEKKTTVVKRKATPADLLKTV